MSRVSIQRPAFRISGEKLKQVRGNRRAVDVAAAIGARKQMVWHWEKYGNPSADWLATLLLYYGVGLKEVVEEAQVNTHIDKNTQLGYNGIQ